MRNKQDIHSLRRAFQGVYREALRRMNSEGLSAKAKTALLLRFSQLENSVFENVAQHTETQVAPSKTLAQKDENGEPSIEPFDTILKRSLDNLEAKLQALVKEVDNMRKYIPLSALAVRSFADDLEREDVVVDEKVPKKDSDENVVLSTNFNREVYESLARKVSMISKTIAELTDDVPGMISDSINDLKVASEFLASEANRVDVAMATALDPQNSDGRGDPMNNSIASHGGVGGKRKTQRGSGRQGSSAKTPRTTLRDMIIQNAKVSV